MMSLVRPSFFSCNGMPVLLQARAKRVGTAEECVRWPRFTVFRLGLSFRGFWAPAIPPEPAWGCHWTTQRSMPSQIQKPSISTHCYAVVATTVPSTYCNLRQHRPNEICGACYRSSLLFLVMHCMYGMNHCLGDCLLDVLPLWKPREDMQEKQNRRPCPVRGDTAEAGHNTSVLPRLVGLILRVRDFPHVSAGPGR